MNDFDYLQQALKLAELRRGFCAPNPSVGAVVVKAQQVLAEGYHHMQGAPHAEVAALSQLTEASAQGATLYTTLEPCCHTEKRTPPCTELILARGLARVVYAYRDPNPAVSGKGEAYLKAAGVDCLHYPLTDITAFYQSYDHWWKTRKPFVTVKIAQSLNGVFASLTGEPLTITGKPVQRFTHQCRLASDALLTTVTTIQKDDPLLNIRLMDSAVISKPLYIIDTQLRMPLNARVWKTAKKITLFHSEPVDEQQKRALIAAGAQCVNIPSSADGLDLEAILRHIGEDGVHDLWVEAGGRCVMAFFNAKLIQRLLVYIAPSFLEGQRFPMDIRRDTLTPEQTKKWYIWGDDVVCDILFEK